MNRGFAFRACSSSHLVCMIRLGFRGGGGDGGNLLNCEENRPKGREDRGAFRKAIRFGRKHGAFGGIWVLKLFSRLLDSIVRSSFRKGCAGG